MEDIKKPSVIGRFDGKCCDGNVFNNNDMHLSSELFDNLFNSEEYKNAMKNRYYIGFLGHPADPNCMDFKDACIVMTECHIDENGEVFGSFDLIDTPVGRVVKSFIDAGVTFGISIRGAGDVDGEGNVDPETFVFRGFDLVTFPAYDDCVPSFQEIAASSELDKQVKYKKVCSTIKKNLQSITSAVALETIQAQLREGTDEYASVEDRLDEVNGKCEDECENIDADKLEGMTQLFCEAIQASSKLEAENKQLRSELAAAKRSGHNTEVHCSRRIDAIKRITAAQMSDMDEEISRLESESKRNAIAASKLSEKVKVLSSQLIDIRGREEDQLAVTAGLKATVAKLKDENLKYVHKIEANSKTISQKESTISKLESDLRETVTASTKVKKEASNLDENVRSLQQRVEAAEEMVLNYQQAYANMYANALGVRISNLSVTASTSVDELQKLICSRTVSNRPEESDSEFEFEQPLGPDDTVTM